MADSIDKIASDLSISKSMINKEIALIKSGLKKALEREGYKV
jgi:biotin operon repressor